MTTTPTRFFHLNPIGAARTRLEEAEYYFLQSNLNEALAAAQQAWREHPQEPDVFRVLAYVHMARGEYQPAAQAGYQAVLLDGQNPASYATLAQVYVTFNLLQQADETLTTALQHFPEDATLLALAADVRFRRRRDGDAVEMATLALQKNPHDGYTKALLGSHHLKEKHYTAAEKLLRDAIEAYPQRWDYLRDYGIAAVHVEHYEPAAKALASGFRQHGEDLLTKHYLYFALRLMVETWQINPRIALFFYETPWLGWLLWIIGWVTILVTTFIGAVSAVVDITDITLESSIWTALFFFAGIALVLLTHHGIFARNKKGRKFDALLVRLLEKAGV